MLMKLITYITLKWFFFYFNGYFP